jgi:DNA polymerase-3 subunit epsilon
MAREIILDTETTGLDPQRGHRLIEIGCIEIDDLLPTGRSWHCFLDPERQIDPDAIRVHGVTDAMVRGKPKFADVADEFLAFLGDDPVVAHNAAFDRGFINHELERIARLAVPVSRWIDTYGLAQKRFPGASNSLDALCRRFKISLAEREKHGALIDAKLLAAVYLELRGGKERGLDFAAVTTTGAAVTAIEQVDYGPRPRPIGSRATAQELAAHADFLKSALKDKAIWNDILTQQA